MRVARSVAIGVTLAVIAGVLTITGFSTPASAAENGIKPIQDTLGNVANWTKGLGQVGKLADALPAFSGTPGAVLGTADLVQKAIADQFTSATSWSDLAVDKDITIDSNRSGHLTTTVSDADGGKRLDVHLHVVANLPNPVLSLPVPIGAQSNAPKSSLGGEGGLSLTVSADLDFALVWDSTLSPDPVYVVHTDATPRIDVDVDGHIAALGAMKASVGVLGVTLGTGSTLQLVAHFTSKVTDPDNDGKLFFTQPGGAANSGELGQPGSLAGLVTMGFDTPAGSLNGHLAVGATKVSGLIDDLPQAAGAVEVAWPDISTGTPTVTPTGLDSVGKFLNMTPQDLADSLGQVVSALDSIQHRKWSGGGLNLGNLDLPFMQGSFADAMAINESLKKFLADNTKDASQQSAPTFVSIQELLQKLNDTASSQLAGADIGISNVAFDDAASKMTFKLGITKAPPAAAQKLDEASAAVTGTIGSTFGSDTMKVDGANWKANQWAGHRVVAGTSGGTIASNTADEIKLTGNWAPSTPAADSPYSISTGAALAGAVTLGDALGQKQPGDVPAKGIDKANAVQTTATVTPSYSASLTLVLDLQNPVVLPSPQTIQNKDGTSTIVTQTPLNTDRILIRTSASDPIFTADLPVDTKVDLFANAGFLKVKLGGELHLCQTNAGDDCNSTPGPNDHMLSVGWASGLGDLSMGTLFDKLVTDPGSLLQPQIHARAAGTVSVSVPGTPDFLGSGAAEVPITWTDLTNPATLTVDTSHVSDFVKFDVDPSNPRALFSAILQSLKMISQGLGSTSASSAGIVNSDIPFINRSLKDLLLSDVSSTGAGVSYTANTLVDPSAHFTQDLEGRSVIVGTQVGVVLHVTDATHLTFVSSWQTPAAGTGYAFRSGLDDAISLLDAAPPDTLQDLVGVLNDKLAKNTPVEFSYDEPNGQPSLILKLKWHRHYESSAPFNLDLGLPDVGGLVGAKGDGSLHAGVDGDVNLGFAVPLVTGSGPDQPSGLKVLDDSKISFDATADASGHLSTTLGPLSLAVGNPKGGDDIDAHAHYRVALAKPGGTGATSDFVSFLNAVTATVNGGNTPAVTCTNQPAVTDALALCAHLPLYISNDGGQNYSKLVTDPSKSDAVEIRMPQTDADADPVHLLDPTKQIDGKPRVELDAAAVSAALTSQLSTFGLNFQNLDGIDGYLNAVETALRTASFGGKLPLVGDDLQQGADFVGKIRKEFHQAIGALPSNGHLSDSAAVKGFFNTTLANDLGIPAGEVTVDLLCQSTLSSPAAPTVVATPSPAAGPNTYVYATVAYALDGSNKLDTASPVPAAGVLGPATLDGTHFNTVTPKAVSGADGYKLLRRTNGGAWQLLADLGTSLAPVKDDGHFSQQSYAVSINSPKSRNCGFTDVDTVTVSLDLGQGKFDANHLPDCGDNNANGCISKDVPLDIGIPGLSLTAKDGGTGPHVDVAWGLHLKFGISSKGFFVDTGAAGSDPELQLGVAFGLPSTGIAAQLAFLNVAVTNCTSADTNNCAAGAPATAAAPFSGYFGVDLHPKAGSPAGDHELTLDELTSASLSDLATVQLTAKVDIDWLIKADITSALPGIQTEFRLGWSWSKADPNASGSTGLTISFQKVQLDTGAFFGELIQPVVDKIKEITGPLQPIIDTLYAPIPVLSDLSHLVGGDDITIVSLAKAFSTLTGGPDLDFVDTIHSLIDFLGNLPTCTGSGPNDTHCLIPIGSFDVAGPKALTTTSTPDNADSLRVPQAPLDASPIKAALDTAGGKGAVFADSSAPGTPNSKKTSASGKSGFSFPVFDHPEQLFNLLLGGDVDIVQFDSGPLTLAFDWRQSFGPVYAPPPVMLTLSGSASVTAHMIAGFDTYGIRKTIELSKSNDTFAQKLDGLKSIFEGLYFKTTDADGKPLPVVTFTGEIAAGAAVSAVIIEVGIEGGVRLTVGFRWNDPNADGKFRLTEFIDQLQRSPICLFQVDGALSIFLRLHVTIGVSIFSVTFSFELANITLLDFSATPNCDPPPPVLGTTVGDTLVVYAGRLGDLRGPDWHNDAIGDKTVVKVTSLHDYDDAGASTFKGFAVEALGFRQEFLGTGLNRVVVDGTNYAKPMQVTMVGDGDETRNGDKAKQDPNNTAAPATSPFEKDAVVIGGNDNDTIKTGIGNSWVDGGVGDDVIVTGDRTTTVSPDSTQFVRNDAFARVAGGPGNDHITVGNGADVVAGDSALPRQTHALGIVDWTKPIGDPGGGDNGSADGADSVQVGFGHDTLFGNGNDDTISVAPPSVLATVASNHADFESAGVTVYGGSGSDNITSGTGDDNIYTGKPPSGEDTGVDGAGTPDTLNGAGLPNRVVTGSGNDHVFGGTAADDVTGQSEKTQTDDLRGGGGNDILTGGLGSDTIAGGPDQDYVIAEPSTVDTDHPGGTSSFGPEYTVTHTALPAGVASSPKTLIGGLGNDHVIGGDGTTAVFGDQQKNPCVAGPVVESDPPSELGEGFDGNDLITGGAGVDTIAAGGGNDVADAKANTDDVCGQAGVDVLTGGADNDREWGGTGNDVLHGDSGADHLYGNAQNDAIYGSTGDDIIEGNQDSDWAFGDAGNDVIIGGTRAAAQPDANDYLFGGADPDTIIGDNTTNGGNLVPVDLDGLGVGLGGADFISGGTANDTEYGGLADDTMYGDANDDHMEGDNGADKMFGNDGEDEIIGGGFEQASIGVGHPDSGDTIDGGAQADVITGDNAIIVKSSDPTNGTPVTLGRGFASGHTVTLLDLGDTPVLGTSGQDTIDGGDAQDVIYGQGDHDTLYGDAGDDAVEGDQGPDSISGGTGSDDLVGGNSTTSSGSGAATVGQPDTGDVISGGDAEDVVLGDNGVVLRGPGTTPSPLTQGRAPMSPREIRLYDLGLTPTAGRSGDDVVDGDDGLDVILGQSGNDRLKGDAADDYVEGSQGSDWVEGDAGDDDVIGGSSTVLSGSGTATAGQLDLADALWGGPGDDVVTGDNGLVLRIGSRTRTTDRLGSTSGVRMDSRSIQLFDLNGPNFLTAGPSNRYGSDLISGGAGVDVEYGQDGNDAVSGGPGADYMEGNGGGDNLRGDLLLSQPGRVAVTMLATVWPGAPSAPDLLEGDGTDGQDDQVGGSGLPAFRDGADSIEGNGAADFQLGDNGTMARDVSGSDGSATERKFVERYPSGPLPADAAVIRIHDPAVPNANGTMRFCTMAQSTCEVANASGNDSMWGDAGDDSMWGQDGNDTMSGGANNDDMFGELGNDSMFGDAGEDAMVGDRGGVVNQYINPNDSGLQFTRTLNSPPAETFTGFRQGSYDRRVDLLHDIDGDQWVGAANSEAMPHPGLNEGGDDRIRGGLDADNIHAAWGDDLANGDSAGDQVYGDDGADVLWGGDGCDPVANAATSDCLTNGKFDASSRGTNDRFVDHLFGGVGGTSAASIAGASGSDIMDRRPRGNPATCANAAWPVTDGNKKAPVTNDPCSWFQMTGTDNDTADPATLLDNQHHQGTDWMYGGWDRDVMEGDVAANGPNPGDRLLDWTGAYNLYNHCNSAYGGFNDVRQFSPAMQDFLQQLVWGTGAGRSTTDSSTKGYSAYRELALGYPGETDHLAGPAYPTTPGHFDDPSCGP